MKNPTADGDSSPPPRRKEPAEAPLGSLAGAPGAGDPALEKTGPGDDPPALAFRPSSGSKHPGGACLGPSRAEGGLRPGDGDGPGRSAPGSGRSGSTASVRFGPGWTGGGADDVAVAKSLLKKVYRYRSSDEVRAMGLYPYFRRIQSCQNPVVRIEGREFIMMGSNNYLGLVSEPRVIEAAREAARKYGTGCAGSRLLNGTLDIHEELEARLAAFVKKEAALLYSTGYQANLGAIATLAGRNDSVVMDRRDHASIVDAVQLSRAEPHRFRHNDVEHLDKVLSSLDRDRGVLVVVDGVFSMEGDVAKLPEIVDLCDRHGAVLMVDDAHGLGVLGPGGRGTCEHFGLTGRVELIMGTFSKSLASIGGFVASDKETVDFLRHNSRAMIFSASMPPASVGSVLKALELIEKEPERIDKLWRNTEYMRRELRSLGFDTGASTTPIIPIRVGEDVAAFKFCCMLHDEGVFVNPVPGLSLEPGNALIRISLMATHEQKHLAAALEKIEKVGRALGLVPANA
ncbi:MAG: aminotransferase class I/II-fold pyridoxal phosphate-dependent enzyme [Planctomycetota bacterium]